jgi:hypothetical protein
VHKLTNVIAATIFALLGLGLRAEADVKVQHAPGITADQLQKKCDAAGGSFATEEWGGYSCTGQGGWAVNCYNDETCFSWCTNQPKKCPVGGGGGRVQVQGGKIGIVGGSVAGFPASAGAAGASTFVGATTSGTMKNGTTSAAPSRLPAPLSTTANSIVVPGLLVAPSGSNATKRKPF